MTASFNISPEKRAGMPHFFYRQLFVNTPPVSRDDAHLNGKTAIVTGANRGLGLETAGQLLDLGCKVILAVRDVEMGEKARQQLTSARKLKEDVIEVWPLDLSSYKSITDFADRAKGLESLDVAILNAGLYKVHETFTSNGYEESIQVNYLSNMLLTTLLLPIIAEKKIGADPGHIVLASSDIAAWSKFEERSAKPLLPIFKEKMSKWVVPDRYGTSKVLGQLFYMELAERVPPSSVTISCANPGLCHGSDLGRQFSGFAHYAFAVLSRLFGRPCGVGARTFVRAASALGQDSHGQYIEDGKIQPMVPLAYKPEGKQVARRLYEETLDELAFAGARDIVVGFGHAK